MSLLREADRAPDLTRRLADCFENHRSQERVEHPVWRLVGLVLGGEDLNDHDELRDDSLLALTAGCDDLTGENRVRERDRGHPLASSKTLNRLELGEPDRYKKADMKAMDELMVDLFLEAPLSKEIFLDLDSTDDPLHVNQEGRFFHGYYGCYLPLYVVCGNHVLCSRLRPSNVDGAAGSVEELARIVERIRKRWPKTRIVVRGARFVVTSLSRKRAGAQVLYEKLYCARGENGIKEQQFVRRPDVDRDTVRQRLYFATFAGSGGVSETRPRRRRGRQGPGRAKFLKVAVCISVRRVPLSFSSTCAGTVRPGPGEPAGGGGGVAPFVVPAAPPPPR